MDAGLVHLHLVESPRIAKVGDPGDVEAVREGVCDARRLERRHRREHDVDVARRAPGPDRSVGPPARPRRLLAKPALAPPSPAVAPPGLGARHPVYLETRRQLRRKRVVDRLASAPSRPGEHNRLVAELRQVAHELHGALNTRATDGREVVGDHECPFHDRGR